MVVLRVITAGIVSANPSPDPADTNLFQKNTFTNITGVGNGGAIYLNNLNAIVTGNRFVNVTN